MPIIKKRLQFHVAAMAGDIFLSMLSSTWKVSIEDSEGVLCSIAKKEYACITTFWHRYLLPMLCIFRGYPVCVPVSEHKDGEYVAHIMERYGLRAVRGSTTRGSLRMIRELTENIAAGLSCAITPDGPRGPKYRVQPGFILPSRRTGAPVYPIGVAVSKSWKFNSWDELVLPKPFAGIRVVVGEAIKVSSGRDVNRQCETLRSKMVECEEKAAFFFKTHGTETEWK